MATTNGRGPGSFASLLLRYRLAAGLSQEELAARAGLSRRGISDLERGERRSPHPATARRLAEALDLDSSQRTALLASSTRSVAHLASPEAPLGGRGAPNLPAQPTPLIGRESELGAMRKWLLEERVRLLTLTGPGGAGKTRLALEAAAQLHDSFEHGAFVVDLSPIVDHALVISAMAHVLGVREPGDRPLLDAIADHLRDKQVLLLLDNFEQVLEAAPALADLLRTCPGLRVLVTSREPLCLSWEHLLPVPPLALPELGRDSAIESMAESPAARLFLLRARAVQPDLATGPAELRAVAELCRLLDGLPLAIELAAAQSDVLSPSELLAGLQSRRLDLANATRDVAARHRSVRATIAWSYERLSAEEQELLRRLAVFPGGCSLEQVGSVCGPMDAAVLRDGLVSLVRKNLLRREPAPDGGSRFRMLEVVREYADQWLAQVGERDIYRQRQATYFVEFAERAEVQASHGAQRRLWLDRLEHEMDNLRAALRWAIEHTDAEAGLRLGQALGLYWFVRNQLSEGRAWLAEVLGLPGASVPTSARAGALLAKGILESEVGEAAAARTSYEEALAIARRVGAQVTVARALNNLGVSAIAEGDYQRARDLLVEGVAVSRAMQDRSREGLCLRTLSRATLGSGDVSGARELMEQSLAAWQDVGDAWGTASALEGLGEIARLQNEHDAARAYYEQGLALNGRVGDRQRVARCLVGLGWTALDRRDHAEAQRRFGESLTILSELGDRTGVAGALEGLTGVAVLGAEAPEYALWLAAAAARQREATHSQPMPAERAQLEAWLASARGRIGNAGASAAWAHGRCLSIDQAVGEALAMPTAEPAAATHDQPLTRRELEVAACLARGLTNRQTAEQLVVTERTVAAHVEHMLAKLNLSSRTQVAVWAAGQGLLARDTA